MDVSWIDGRVPMPHLTRAICQPTTCTHPPTQTHAHPQARLPAHWQRFLGELVEDGDPEGTMRCVRSCVHVWVWAYTSSCVTPSLSRSPSGPKHTTHTCSYPQRPVRGVHPRVLHIRHDAAPGAFEAVHDGGRDEEDEPRPARATQGGGGGG